MIRTTLLVLFLIFGMLLPMVLVTLKVFGFVDSVTAIPERLLSGRETVEHFAEGPAKTGLEMLERWRERLAGPADEAAAEDAGAAPGAH